MKDESVLDGIEQSILSAARMGEFLRFPLDAKPKVAASFLVDLLSESYGALHPRGIHVEGIEVEGVFDIENRQIDVWIYFVNCDFPKGMMMRDARLVGLFLPGCKVGKGIRADRMLVSGAVLMTAGFECKGGMALPAAEIGGVLSCIGGYFESEKGPAIDASGLRVRDSVFLRADFRAKGEVRFLEAEIGGILSCIGGVIENEKGRALYADGLKATGGVFLRDGFSAKGDISLVAADFGKMLSIRGGNFEGKLDIRHAQTQVFDDDEKSWPQQGKLLIDGFRYERFADKAPLDFALRKRWLEHQDVDRFTPQPYEQLAKVLKALGHRRDARLALMEKEREFRRKGRLRTFRWLWSHVSEATIGFGYTPWRAVIWMLGLWLLGALVFFAANGLGIMGPSGTALEAYQPFLPAVYALDTLLPLVDLKQEAYWLPLVPGNSSPLAAWLTLAYLWLHILMGWFLTGMGLFGLSGVMKRDY
jgi:hypothetical protein